MVRLPGDTDPRRALWRRSPKDYTMSLSTSPSPSAPTQPAPARAPYQAPAIESVLSPADLQREVLYAGTPVSVPDAPPISF